MTCAELLIRLLHDRYNVDTMFGIPGVHTVELYRGLEKSGVRHITPRHEQGAGFMADGYARATGNPGVCLIITGPGMTNITTAMGQALADSVPMLVISSVNRIATLGRGQGRLHELESQQRLVANVARFSHTLLDPDGLPEVLARAYAVFQGQRPGPVHIEIPIDLFEASATPPIHWAAPIIYPPAPDPSGLAKAARLLHEAHAPLVLLGGGCTKAPEAARELITRLDAPTATTVNAKGLLGDSHPLDLGANTGLPAVRELAREADVILAIGTELGETDYDVVFDDGFALTGQLIRIDIDAQQLVRNQDVALGLIADAALAIQGLLAYFPKKLERDGFARTHKTLEKLALDASFSPFLLLCSTLCEALPNAIWVGDSTAPVYAANHVLALPAPRHYFNAATGYGTLGYGLPASLGAQIAKPDLPVIALVGDGGIMFTLSELATAVEYQLPVIILLWHNHGYEEIRHYMDKHNVERLGVDIQAPDFIAVAKGFGCATARIGKPAELTEALNARPINKPYLLEIDADKWLKN